MLTVLLHWQYKVWDNEVNHLWQQCVCHHVCSLVYMLAPKSGVSQYDLGFLITLYTCVMSHSLFLPSIIVIISGSRYNLWSYTLCSFLQYPITFSHKVKELFNTVPIATLQSFLNVTDQVSNPQILQYYANRNFLHFKSHAFRKQEEQNTTKL